MVHDSGKEVIGKAKETAGTASQATEAAFPTT